MYRQKSNLITSISVKKKDESDFLDLKEYLKDNRYSVSDYLVYCWKSGVKFDNDK